MNTISIKAAVKSRIKCVCELLSVVWSCHKCPHSQPCSASWQKKHTSPAQWRVLHAMHKQYIVMLKVKVQMNAQSTRVYFYKIDRATKTSDLRALSISFNSKLTGLLTSPSLCLQANLMNWNTSTTPLILSRFSWACKVMNTPVRPIPLLCVCVCVGGGGGSSSKT